MLLESRSVVVAGALVVLFAGGCEGARAWKTDAEVDPVTTGSGGNGIVASGSGGDMTSVDGSGGSGGDTVVPGSGGVDVAGSGGSSSDGSGGSNGTDADAGVIDASVAIDAPTGDAAVTDAGVADVHLAFDGPPAVCVPGASQCNNCIDDDGDGKTDSADPECTGMADNDEATYATGIPGDNMDDGTSCHQDCFFDGNSGQGDDCNWNLRCDPLRVGTPHCAYDGSNCLTQTNTCVSSCLTRTPNGCDCFGCCLPPGATQAIRLGKSCTEKDLGDPTKCQPCTQDTSCLNPCEHCELCVGKTAPEPDCFATPDAGTGDAGSSGGDDGGIGEEIPGNCGEQVYCGPGSAGLCPEGTYCTTGCCLTAVP